MWSVTLESIIQEFSKHFYEVCNPKESRDLPESAKEYALKGFSRDPMKLVSLSIPSPLSPPCSFVLGGLACSDKCV